jgi:hypothetical protein
MVAAAEAQEIADDLSGVEASVDDLVGPEEMVREGTSEVTRKTLVFGTSLMTERKARAFAKNGFFPSDDWRLLEGETTPTPHADEAVVLRDFFICGLRFPCIKLVRAVLDSFNFELHQLTPNAIVTLTKFSWACLSFGVEPSIHTFCDHFDLHR